MALRHLGFAPSPPLLLVVPLLILPFLRPPSLSPGVLLGALAVAGWLHADAWARERSRDCRLSLQDAQVLELEGRVVGAWRRGVSIVAERGLPCRAEIRLTTQDEGGPVQGGRIEVRGRWTRWGRTDDPELAGELRVEEWGSATGPELGGGVPRWREAVRLRIETLYPARHALVSALVLARKERVAPEVSEAFARAGVAHLLAISGFHVGVVALLVLAGLRGAGLARRGAAVIGVAVVWGYVGFIGAPDAAVRAAVLMSLMTIGVLRGAPVHRLGALAAGLLCFLVCDPGALGRVGFQLSFAGVAGLVVAAPVIDSALAAVPGSRRWPGLRLALAAGLAATLATLPLVAWHFDRVSVVGIPVTLAATPLVAVAIPGVFASLLLGFAPGMAGPAAFVAGGTDLLLLILLRLVEGAASLAWAVAWVPRGWLLAGALGALSAVTVSVPPRGVGREVRLVLGVSGAVAGVLMAGPLGRITAAGSVEIVALDVGQGDAIALRSPAGRWVLIDAGPGPSDRAGEEPPASVTELRRRGVGKVEALLLTHPDLDHIGGTSAILRDFGPRLVAGPGHVRGTEAYVDGLRTAGGDVPWLLLRRGDRLEIDGLRLHVLHPSRDPTPEDEPNASSLVILARYGAFTALLTGDAPREVEDELAEAVGDVDLLKVAHHGSSTSSSAEFLATVRPEVALVSAGRWNRYGHPHPQVLQRLVAAHAEIGRTDEDGAVRVVAKPDGSWVLRRER